jgi:hypothetical protein
VRTSPKTPPDALAKSNSIALVEQRDVSPDVEQRTAVSARAEIVAISARAKA